jgi:hypothetical protein
LPQAQLKIMPTLEAAFPSDNEGIDAAAHPAERASAWTLLHPQFTVVVRQPVTVKVPLAYPITRDDARFVSFVNTWIELKRKDGTMDALYRYWILGQTAAARQRRCSVIRNVLHWVESRRRTRTAGTLAPTSVPARGVEETSSALNPPPVICLRGRLQSRPRLSTFRSTRRPTLGTPSRLTTKSM